MFLRVYDAQGALKNTSANFTDAEIKTKYEANADTNAYTDAEQTKLGIAATAGGAFHDGFSDYVLAEHVDVTDGTVAGFNVVAIDASAANAKAVTIDASEYCGFGTAPANRVHILDATAWPLKVARVASNVGAGVGVAFSLQDSAGAYISYVDIFGGIKANTAGSADGYFMIRTLKSGVMTEDVRSTKDGFGIGTASAANPLAVNRSEDGVIIDLESADIVEGTISIAGSTTSYNAFVGSHYTQLKTGQKELPVGAVVIATGDIVKSSQVFTEDEKEKLVSRAKGIETVEITEDEVQTKTVTVDAPDPKDKTKTVRVRVVVAKTVDETEYELDDKTGKVKTRIVKRPVTKRITKTVKRLKENVRLDEKTGKLYEKVTTRTGKDITGVKGKEYFPYIDTTSIAGDKRIYGVWHSRMSDDSKGQSFGQDTKPVYLISQVGLFKVRVTDSNGNIEVGDWLETSNRPMEAQKQSSASKLNSTIGKAMIDVDWSTVPTDSVLGYKWLLIPVIF